MGADHFVHKPISIPYQHHYGPLMSQYNDQEPSKHNFWLKSSKNPNKQSSNNHQPLWKDITQNNTFYRHQYGKFKTFRHIQTGQEVQKYRIRLNDQDQYKNWFELMKWRNARNDVLVKVQYYAICKNQQFCSSRYQFDVFLEHIPLRLSDLTDIPFPENLYFLYATLKGFRAILERHPHGCRIFKPNQSMIGVTKEGIVKVWLNSDFSLHLPPSDNIMQINHHQLQCQEVIRLLVDMIEDNTDAKDYIVSFRKYLSGKRFVIRDFGQVIRQVINYSRDFGVEIPRYVFSVREILSSQSRSEESFRQGNRDYWRGGEDEFGQEQASKNSNQEQRQGIGVEQKTIISQPPKLNHLHSSFQYLRNNSHPHYLQQNFSQQHKINSYHNNFPHYHHHQQKGQLQKIDSNIKQYQKNIKKDSISNYQNINQNYNGINSNQESFPQGKLVGMRKNKQVKLKDVINNSSRSNMNVIDRTNNDVTFNLQYNQTLKHPKDQPNNHPQPTIPFQSDLCLENKLGRNIYQIRQLVPHVLQQISPQHQPSSVQQISNSTRINNYERGNNENRIVIEQISQGINIPRNAQSHDNNTPNHPSYQNYNNNTVYLPAFHSFQPKISQPYPISSNIKNQWNFTSNKSTNNPHHPQLQTYPSFPQHYPNQYQSQPQPQQQTYQLKNLHQRINNHQNQQSNKLNEVSQINSLNIFNNRQVQKQSQYSKDQGVNGEIMVKTLRPNDKSMFGKKEQQQNKGNNAGREHLNGQQKATYLNIYTQRVKYFNKQDQESTVDPEIAADLLKILQKPHNQ